MADYFTQFSCILDVGTAENATKAKAIRATFEAELDRDEGVSLGFEMDVDLDTGPGALWLHGDAYGDPEHVIRFVLGCAEAFDLSGVWGFCWALSCSRPRCGSFGGGAQMLDLGQRTQLGWIDCAHWLAEQSAAPTPATTGRPTVDAAAAS